MTEGALAQYKELASAAIIQASTDYLDYKYKAENAEDIFTRNLAQAEMKSIEEFFNSERFKMYSELNGRELLKGLKHMQPRKAKRGKGSIKYVRNEGRGRYGRCKVDKDNNGCI